MKRAYFIPGLAADERVYYQIDLPDVDRVYVNYIEPHKNESIGSYCQRLIEQYSIPDDSILVGNSMGGIMAMEMSRYLKPSKIILISSISSDKELPWYFRMFRKLPWYETLPHALTKNILVKLTPGFGDIKPEEKQYFQSMIDETSDHLFNWSLKAALDWEAPECPDCVYRLHGEKDSLFPRKFIKQPTDTILGGTHIVMVREPNLISQKLAEQIANV